MTRVIVNTVIMATVMARVRTSPGYMNGQRWCTGHTESRRDRITSTDVFRHDAILRFTL